MPVRVQGAKRSFKFLISCFELGKWRRWKRQWRSSIYGVAEPEVRSHYRENGERASFDSMSETNSRKKKWRGTVADMNLTQKVLPTAAVISLVLACGFLFICAYSFACDPLYKEPTRYIAITQNVNITVTKHWSGGSLVIFNTELPYLRNITSGIAGYDTSTSGGFNFVGISYSVFKKSSMPGPWWSVIISLWYPIVLSGAVPMFWLVRRKRDKKQLSPATQITGC